MGNLTIRLDPKLLSQIAKAAKADDRSISNWIQTILKRELAARASQKGDTHG